MAGGADVRVFWIDPLNTNPHFTHLMATVLRDEGHDLEVRSIVRDGFPPPDGVRWSPFAPMASAPASFRERPLAAARLAATYSLRWRSATRWARQRGARAIVVSTNLRLARADAMALRGARRRQLAPVVVAHRPWWTFFADGKASAADRAFYQAAARVLTMDEPTRAALRGACRLPAAKLGHLPHPHFQNMLDQVEPAPALTRRLRAWLTTSDGAQKPPVVAFLSQMRGNHGFDDLLAALPLIDATLPWRLLVVSSRVPPQKAAAIERWLTERGWRERCHLRWHPYSHAELKAFLDVASMVVIPYRVSGPSAVAALAAGAGLPLVATDVGDLAAGVRAGVNGEIAPPAAPAALAVAIARVAAALPRYQREARRPSDRYSPHRAAQALVSALRSAAEDAKDPSAR